MSQLRSYIFWIIATVNILVASIAKFSEIGLQTAWMITLTLWIMATIEGVHP
jgi:hypothetical protein